MNFFTNKKEEFFLLKYYIKLDSIEKLKFLPELVNLLAEEYNILFDDYSFNYCESKTFNFEKFDKKIQQVNTKDCLPVESIELQDENCIFSVWLGPVFKYLNLGEEVFLLRLSIPIDIPIESINRLINKNTRIFYAYGRKLNNSFSLTTETKIKKSIFGGLKSKVSNEEDEWILSPVHILTGALKGIYEFNLIPNNFQNFNIGEYKKILTKGKIEKLGKNLLTIRFKKKQLMTLREKFKSHANYIRYY